MYDYTYSCKCRDHNVGHLFDYDHWQTLLLIMELQTNVWYNLVTIQ